MPDRPSKLDLPIVLGEFRGVAHTAIAKFQGISFSISYSDLAINPEDPAVADKVFEGARESALSNSPAKVLSETKIASEGNPGRELQLDLAGAIVVSRTYLVKNRIYQLVITFAKGKSTAIRAVAFFDSFSVGDDAGKKGPDGEKVFVPLPPPPPSPPSPCSPGNVPKMVKRSEGVVRGNAIDLIRPQYPPDAIAAHASGKVEVEILVDEQGNVIGAKATSGHLLLQQAGVDAASRSKFKPVFFCGTAVKVSSVLTYNFSPN